MNGSEIAKSGYDNEYRLVEMFKSFEDHPEAQEMLRQMGFEPSELLAGDVTATKIPGTVKADIELIIKGESRLVSAKKYMPGADYNHVARSSVDSYHKSFGFTDTVRECLEVFTGSVLPCDNPDVLAKDVNHTRSRKRATLREIKERYVEDTLGFFRDNSGKIVDHIFCGSHKQRPDYMIITKITNGEKPGYYLIPMDKVVGFYLGAGNVSISPRGSLSLGAFITVQRKGGTGSPTNLQFKFKPSAIVKTLGASHC